MQKLTAIVTILISTCGPAVFYACSGSDAPTIPSPRQSSSQRELDAAAASSPPPWDPCAPRFVPIECKPYNERKDAPYPMP